MGIFLQTGVAMADSDHVLTITGNDGSARIDIELVSTSKAEDAFIFRYEDIAFTTRIEVSTCGAAPLNHFFDDLEEHWRGWAGDKFWSSDSHDLVLTARSDNLGHVRLQIETERHNNHSTRFQTGVDLEPAQIERAARKLRKMFPRPPAPYDPIYGAPEKRSVAMVTIVVDDYDKAIAFYRAALGFSVIQNRDLGGGKRWVVLDTGHGKGARILLARAVNPQQAMAIGNQTGGRVFLFLETDDFERDHAAFIGNGVKFTEMPRREPYGVVAVFEDLCGNRWDLIEPAKH